MLFKEKTPLTVPRNLKRALLLHRIRAGIAGQEPIVIKASIDEVQQALGVSLPHELLAVFAATGRDPYEMILLTEEARELDDLSPGLVAVSVEPPRSDASQLPVYWCFNADSGTQRSRETVRWALDPEDRRYRLSMLDLVRACYLDGGPTEEEMMAIRGLSVRFRPAIVTQPRIPFRRIVHDQFGPGFVLREFNDGNHKVEAEFPRVGKKLLLASYVCDAREVGSHSPARTTRAKPATARRRLR